VGDESIVEEIVEPVHGEAMTEAMRLWNEQGGTQRARGKARLMAASSARSAGSNLGRGDWRRSTASC